MWCQFEMLFLDVSLNEQDDMSIRESKCSSNALKIKKEE